jgi:hypothetical protein
VMFRRQYERALRMLWEHRDRQRELSAPATNPRRRKRNTSPDSPLDFPSPSPTDFPSASHPGFPSPSPTDFPPATNTAFPPALAGGCIPTVPDSLFNSASGCIPPVPPPAPETLAPQHPPNPKTAILRNEPKPAPRPKRCRAGAARRAAAKRFPTLLSLPTPPIAPKARPIDPTPSPSPTLLPSVSAEGCIPPAPPPSPGKHCPRRLGKAPIRISAKRTETRPNLSASNSRRSLTCSLAGSPRNGFQRLPCAAGSADRHESRTTVPTKAPPSYGPGFRGAAPGGGSPCGLPSSRCSKSRVTR